jgi:hypothetical protein
MPRWSRATDWKPTEPNPETPPDSQDPSGPCPRCGNRSNFSVVGKVGVTFSGNMLLHAIGAEERDAVQQAAILECLGCRRRIVVIEDRYVDDERDVEPPPGGIRAGMVNFRGVWWWPPPGAGDLDESIPSEIRDAYGEGIKAMSAQAPNAAAVMFRRTLEAVVKTSGSAAAQKAAEDTLWKGLNVMADEGALDKSLAEWAKEIRVVANFGAHFDVTDGVTTDEAENLSRLIRELLRYLYEMPARIQRTRAGPSAST